MAERKQIEQAGNEIAALYKIDLIRHLAGERVHPGRNLKPPTPRWRELANRFPEIGNVILELGEVVDNAEFSRDNILNPQTETLRYAFSPFTVGVDNRAAQFFLTDILNNRIEGTPFGPLHNIAQEAHAMLLEYGLKDGLLTDSSVGVLDLRSAVGKVLSGDLKLSSSNPQ